MLLLVRRYANYAELSRHERVERDYRVRVRRGNSAYAIIAPHGGRIERGTTPIAEAIAGGEHTFYSFDGLKAKQNHTLHLSSNSFDEPSAVQVVKSVETVIAIHGASGKDPVAYFGGLDLCLRKRMRDTLRECGFLAEDDPSPTRQGKRTTNICNRGASGQGVQIELTIGMRKSLFEQVRRDLWVPNQRFHRFVAVLRAVLNEPRRRRTA
jgi:phage replication-related protein YjqB (UPF0714/DUF867 family)